MIRRPVTGSVEKLAAPGDELISARPGADQVDRRADELPDALDVVTALLREVIPAAGGADLGLPSRQLFVERLAVLVMRDVGQRVVVRLAPEPIPGADLEQ